MKIKSTYIIGVIFFVITCLLYNCSNTQVTDSASKHITKNKTLLVYAKGNVYKEDWAIVDSLEQNGLTRSALKQVDKIYEKALQESNHEQVLKSLIVKAKLQSYIEEKAFEATIGRLKLEATKSSYPVDPLLHSIIGELYWQYYNKNRWRFQDRTPTNDFKHRDISTWSLKEILDAAKQQYILSIQNIDSLRRTPVETFEELIIEKNARKYRPFLYDFLAHRAIDFFENEESNLLNPAYKFSLDDPKYLKPFSEFVTIELDLQKELSMKYDVMKTFQLLTKSHLNDKDPEALLDVELRRLKFVKNNASFSGVDSLYYSSLINLRKNYAGHPSEAEIVFEIADIHYSNGIKYKPLQGEDNKWELKKALEVCLEAIKKYPTSYGAKRCQYLVDVIEQKSVNVVVEKVNKPNSPLKAKITSKNIDKVYHKLYKVDFDEYRKWNESGKKKENFKKIKSNPLIKEWELDLLDDGDFQSHTGFFKIDQLPLGFYVLLSSTSSEFTITKEAVAISSFWVSNLSYINRKKGSNTNEFLVLNRSTGYPIKGVKANLYHRKYNYTTRKYITELVKTKITDNKGSFLLESTTDYRNYYVDFSYQNDRLNTGDSHYSNKSNVNSQKKYTKTFFFTDRTIYRPGQIVYFKGIVLETDNEKNNRILPNFNSEITFYDVNHQKVSSLELTTNGYGTFSGEFVIPDVGLNGQMHISDSHGSKYFSVEEYKRPTFEVNFSPIKGGYKLEKRVAVSGNAKTYSGAALNDATVNYRVVRNASFSKSCIYKWGYWPQSAQLEIEKGVAKTNNKGEFEIDFEAKTDLSIKKELFPTYSYTIHVDVVDLNGESHSATKTINIGYNALAINIEIPEVVNKNTLDSFNLSTTNLSGELEPAEGNVKIWRLKIPEKYYRPSLLGKVDRPLISREDFEKDFPLDEYDDENDRYKWEKINKVYDRSFNTAIDEKMQLTDLSRWISGYYVLEAVTKDKFGSEVKELKYFTLFDSNEKQLPVNELGWFVKINDKGEPGEEALFLIGSAANNVNVLYEIEHKDQIIKQERLILENKAQRKISIPIKEEYRGNFYVHFTFVKDERKFTYSSVVSVPYTNKKLDIQFETFRNKLVPGQKEEWKVIVKGKKGEKVAAEMVATLYDASLEAFKKNIWGLDIFRYNNSSIYWQSNSAFSTVNSLVFSESWNKRSNYVQKQYDHLNWFGYNIIYPRGRYFNSSNRAALEYDSFEDIIYEETSSASKHKAMAIPTDESVTGVTGAELKKGKQENPKYRLVEARKNFNETAFFYPHLATNEKGEVEIKFTIPETLTRWKFKGLAHTKDLKNGIISEEVITQKELMVYPNSPRFFREKDTLFFDTKIANLSDKVLTGEATISFYDAITMEPITSKVLRKKEENISFNIDKKMSSTVGWEIIVPEGYNAIAYKVIAKAGNFSDGEEKAVPVLTNRLLVTESMPLPVRGNETKKFKLDKLVNNTSKTLRNHRLTLEFTSNPSWYAIQSLPYLIESPYECSEQIFSRFYANSLASHIVNSNPKIATIFNSWRNSSPEAFLSNLKKNKALKSIVIEETPWVLDAKNEHERKKRIGLLFDLNKMSNELSKSEVKLQQLQLSNGGWIWFKGMPENRYITQHIVSGMGHLDHLGVQNIRKNTVTWQMVQKAIAYLDDRIREDYEREKKYSTSITEDHIGQQQIHYLYARSFFNDIPIRSQNKEAYEYYKNQAKKYWLNKSRYMQGMIALAMYRGKKSTGEDMFAQKILASLKDNAIEHEELGMYWKENTGGYYWYEASIETQALLIEAFEEIANDVESVEAMKVWLLKQKQLQNWKTTKATAAACYSLLLRGTDLLDSDQLVEIKVGDRVVDPKEIDNVKEEAGTGYFKTSWGKAEIAPKMGNVTVTKKDEGIAWGALYWQYFEDIDKITSHKTPLELEKKLFVYKNTDKGSVIVPIDAETEINTGDKIKVRIELRVDRNMEYVHMKDMRASGLEPINVFSGYRYQDGLGYYETTKDGSTSFFFDYLNKGTYVFEYTLKANIKGSYSNGITTIQNMYAPEYTSHSQGNRIQIR